MLRYEVVSDRNVTIDGIGELVPGKPVEVDSDMFELAHGYRVSEANFPDFVTVTTVVESEGGE